MSRLSRAGRHSFLHPDLSCILGTWVDECFRCSGVKLLASGSVRRLALLGHDFWSTACELPPSSVISIQLIAPNLSRRMNGTTRMMIWRWTIPLTDVRTICHCSRVQSVIISETGVWPYVHSEICFFFFFFVNFSVREILSEAGRSHTFHHFSL